MTITLSTLNARFSHASLGLRYLRANLGPWREQSTIVEFVIGQKTEDIVERLLAGQPRVVGFGVYIWNVLETTRVVAMLRRVAPDVLIVLGGPEVSFEVEQQPICQLANFVITGWGDVSFPLLIGQIMQGTPPAEKIIKGVQPPLAALALPYGEYSDADLAHRYLYVEASRGCPFKCEFCLSALDKTAWAFPQQAFLQALESLYQRGARTFKFIDRTFNLKIDASLAILEFFLEKLRANPESMVFAHFELVPDHLPEKLRDLIQAFPPGCLQFEVGIQSFNVEVQQRVSRRQDNAKAAENLRWLRQSSSAHLHVDLIAGLPGETMASFAAGFDQLVALAPHEIQFGILKRLRGTPIIRHTDAFQMRFNPEPPYNILCNDVIDFALMQRLTRFARYWDLIANSGKFIRTTARILGSAPFANFLALSDWLFAQTDQTHQIAHERLSQLLYRYLLHLPQPQSEVEADLAADYAHSGARGKLVFGADGQSLLPSKPATPKRQRAHLAS
jgi:radical SAM superfamily enzyme YgiQ (UPF0313 family)